ncbi:hypothetical protein [Streptomyces sp. NPDC012746]|uniref:hypothetical protein n=1 Tax=Streptomyces sp. NPDC012746 TaxID=3364845 RepID=UPI003680439F
MRRKKRPEPMDLTAFDAAAAEDPYHQLTQGIVLHQAMRHRTERQRHILTMTT